MSTPALSPRIRDGAHSSSQSRSSRPTPKPRPTSTRSPAISTTPLTSKRTNITLSTPNHPTTAAPRTPSPNYFGLAFDPNSNSDVFSSSAAQHIRGNWSPPSSNVRSTAAASPRVIPVDQNPEFEQFRRQSENNKAFTLGTLTDFGKNQSVPSLPTKGPVFGNGKAPMSPPRLSPDSSNEVSDNAKEEVTATLTKPRSPKRMLSTDSTVFPDRPRRNSPASFLNRDPNLPNQIAEFAEDRNPRPSLPPQKPGSSHISHHRAETLPTSLEGKSSPDGPTMVTPQHIVNILESAEEAVLLLDLRVSTQYAKARIAGALNLCIPTTLLKRASFNVQKLAETFKEDEHRAKFERWRSSKHIIVYDANSSQLKDAAICINTLKKFTNEKWDGGCYIVRGGFQEFSQKFPAWITHNLTQSPSSATSSLQIDSDLPSVAPVAGGCPMPATQNAANPFFGNIRQNMDLIGGVGQMSITHPASMTNQVEEELPLWLREAAKEADHGKLVSDKFLRIEKREQKRMQEALSGNVSYGTPGANAQSRNNIQIAGIEKGSKNRYNSIWPYEHSRVKLEGVAEGGCDYVNANHVKTSWSNKRYIATQGPLPATFDDFWNVVWQQDVRVIVMLTAEQEGGQLKAHNYWSGKQFGHLHLNFLGEHRASLEPSRIHRHRDRPLMGQRRATNPPKPINMAQENSPSPNSEQPYVIVRKFSMSKGDEPFERMREVTQLQYSSWPDFGAPAHPAHLLGLIEQCDSVVRHVNGGQASGPDPPNGRPVLVHCSAGCGRTGTFCTVDSVIDMLKRQRQSRNARHASPMDIDASSAEPSPFFKSPSPDESWEMKDDSDLIEKTVEEFRLQRLSMVQSLRQFALCYESILEWLVQQYPKSA